MPTCTACHQTKPPEGFYLHKGKRRSQCIDCHLAKAKARYDALPQDLRDLASARWKQKHPDRRREYEAAWMRDRRATAKVACFDHYGWACACCGEAEPAFLVMDHVDGGGNQHRRETSAQYIYLWLVRHGFPEGFQTLCHNCNFAKAHGGCPHQAQRPPS